ncbi:MAG: hypothetical protein HY680_06135 [Chloroflexi bacterium]|nr:hypothetical protein [Chloroflexota bacterium]
MGDYYFERECRTPYSEAYNIVENDAPVGRLDLHFTPDLVHATLCVNESLTREMIEEVIEAIDDNLLDAVGISQEEFIVHVFQGRDAGLYSNDSFEEGEKEEST